MSVIPPAGSITAREAVDAVGRELFPDDWSGDELSGARRRSWFDASESERAGMSRAADARRELRRRLEADEVKSIIVDPENGAKEQGQTAIWRRRDADLFVKRGKAPLFRGSYYREMLGELFVERFQSKPRVLSFGREANGTEVSEVKNFLLQPEIRADTLTRDAQKELVRQTFPTLRLLDKQWRDIFQEVPCVKGRPPKSGGNSGN